MKIVEEENNHEAFEPMKEKVARQQTEKSS